MNSITASTPNLGSLPTDYRLVFDLRKQDGEDLGQLPTGEIDWEPIEQYARLEALRKGCDHAFEPDRVRRIEPVWDAERGEPYVGAVRAVVEDGDNVVASDTPLSYFLSTAETSSSKLVEDGALEKGERFTFSLLAYRGQASPATSEASGITVEEEPVDLKLVERSLTGLLERCELRGERDEADIPVIIPRHVLAECEQMTRDAGATETGGLFIGHLCRDPESGEIFTLITAMISARHTVSETAKLTFTPETWAAAQDALDLRGRNEVLLSSFHSHPQRLGLCGQCPIERRRLCVMRHFFSESDRVFLRTVFAAAWCSAMVVTDTDDGLDVALYGWRRGMVSERHFHVLEGDAVNTAAPHPQPIVTT